MSERLYPLVGGPFDGHTTSIPPVKGDRVTAEGACGYMDGAGEATYLADVDAMCWRYDDPEAPAISLAAMVAVSA